MLSFRFNSPHYENLKNRINTWLYTGKKSFFFMGILAALAWAPYHYIWGLWIGLSTLLVRIWHSSTKKEGFWIGWWWGWGFYIATLFWVGNSLWVDAQRFAWLWPISVFGLPALFAFYTAISCGVIKFIQKKSRAHAIEYTLIFSVIWSLGEKLQSHLFTGFPWNLIAYIWADSLPLAQSACWIGSHGLGLITLLLYGISAMGAMGAVSPRIRFLSITGSMMGFLCLYGIGELRLYHTPLKQSHHLIRLVQPCIPQRQKGNPHYALIHFKKLVDLSGFPVPPSLGDIPHQAKRTVLTPLVTIWPEGALPWGLSPETALSFPAILQSVSPTSILLSGGCYYPSKDSVFNSLLVQYPNEPIRHVYAKKHLLPFGEYIPHRCFLSKILPSQWLQKITPGSQDFSPGPSYEPTRLPHIPPFRTLICYEAIFPEEVCRSTQDRPQWLLNITNDGWFGHSPGPYQHFASARFRAIEQGLPLVRVANTGISAIVDPVGRIIHSLPLYFQGILDGFLPVCLAPTLYARQGNALWWGMILLLSGALGILWLRRRGKVRP